MYILGIYDRSNFHREDDSAMSVILKKRGVFLIAKMWIFKGEVHITFLTNVTLQRYLGEINVIFVPHDIVHINLQMSIC